MKDNLRHCGSSWSFHEELYSGKLRLDDVPYRVHDLGYGAVELQDMFLWPRPPNPIARRWARQAREFDRYEYDPHDAEAASIVCAAARG